MCILQIISQPRVSPIGTRRRIQIYYHIQYTPWTSKVQTRKRLNFGVTSASEVFQNVIRETLEGIPGTLNISDDILVYGTTQEDHDKSLSATLQRLKERNLTLNKAKCEFNKSSLEYFGYKFSAQGISPDPLKVEAIQKAQPPSNPTEVRSLLGMVNFLTRFIPRP